MTSLRNVSFGLIVAVILLAVLYSGCKDDNPATPPDENPQEVITAFILSLVDSPGVAVDVSAAWRDADGPGGNPPQIDTLSLQANVVYETSVLLLDETKTPSDTISNEVMAEADAHRIWPTLGGGIVGLVLIEITDDDGTTPPLPLGLSMKIRVGAGGPTAGTARCVLKHYDPASVKRDDTDSSLGESDVDVTFPVLVQ